MVKQAGRTPLSDRSTISGHVASRNCGARALGLGSRNRCSCGSTIQRAKRGSVTTIQTHRSAFGVTPEMLTNPPPAAAHMLRAFRPVLEREVFLLGGTRGPVRRWPLDDFFDGLETAELEEMGPSASTNRVAGPLGAAARISAQQL